jgi:hypothetical protein
MGYVKPKKVWTKRFSEEKIGELWEIFMMFSPLTREAWENTSFKKAQKAHGNFIHPETDVEDDSEGVQPKQVKNFLEEYSLEQFEHILATISVANDRAALNNYLSDGFISWSSIWENNVIPLFLNEEQKGSFEFKLGMLAVRLSNGFFARFNNISNDVLEAIGRFDITFDDVDQAIKIGTIAENTRDLNLEMLNTKAFFEKRGDLWDAKKKFRPKSEFMLRVNPDNFEKNLLDVVFELFEVRQIGALDDKDQKIISILIDNFGQNLESIPSKLLKDSLKNIGGFDFGNDMIPDFRKELQKFFKDIPVEKHSLKLTKDMINTWSKSEHFRTFIMRKDKLTLSDFDLMNFINGILMQLENRNDKKNITKTIEEISPDMWKAFYRYRVRDPHQIARLFELFEKNKNKQSNVPVFKGKVGSYSYEFIPKNDPRGLVLGYATDCCQVIGGQGQACLETGFRDINSGFFLVEKKGEIYAQSWVWQKETKKGLSLCFDSIEVLGKNLDESKDILGCYQEAASLLVKEHKYKLVYAGADGNTMPKGLEKAGQKFETDEMQELELFSPFGHYSDVNYGVIALAQEEKKKG